MKKIFTELFEQFVKTNGREPNNLEMILIRQKASAEDIRRRKIISMFDRSPVDADKPILGGKNIEETDSQILERLNKGNENSLSNIRYENAVKAEEAKAAADEDYIMQVLDPEDFSKGGRAGLLGERTGYSEGNGVADEDAEKAALGKRVRQLMDEEGFEFGEAVKEAMKEGYASGGRAGLYQGGQAQIEPDLSDVGHGSDALMARNMQLSPGSQATTSTGLNYLLGEDNDTTRVPYKDAGPVVLPQPKPAADPMVELQRIYDLYKKAAPGVSQETQKYLQQDFIQKLNEANISQEQFMTNQMQNNFAEGGPARQNFKMGKRAFLKLMGGVGAGIASLKTGLLGFGKESGKKVAKEVVKEAATGGPPPHFLKLVAKIKALGNDATPKYGSQPREKVTSYKDYQLTEELDSGRTTIQRTKDSEIDYYDEILMEETYMDYIPGKNLADETTKGKNIPDEYTEDTSYMRTSGPQKGDIMETVSGVSDDIYEEAGEVVPEAIRKEKADGGRIGYAGGKKVVEEVIKKANKKLGKKLVTTADKVKIPKETLLRDMFADTNKRLNKSTTPESEKIVGDILEDTDINDLFDADGKLNKDAVLKAAVSKDVKSKSIIPKDEYMEYSKDFDKEILGKYSPENAVDDIFPSGDYKYDADMAAEAYVENNPQMFKNMLYEDLDDRARSEVYSKVLAVISQRNAKMLKMKRNAKSIDISDDAVADDFTNFIKKTDPEGFKELEQKLLLENAKNPKNRKLNATGGLASMLGE